MVVIPKYLMQYFCENLWIKAKSLHFLIFFFGWNEKIHRGVKKAKLQKLCNCPDFYGINYVWNKVL